MVDQRSPLLHRLGRYGDPANPVLVILIGLLWVFIDFFLIPGMVRDKKKAIRKQVMTQLSGAYG